MIEVCLCADDKYMMPAGVCITSIFESNKNEKIRVHLITEGISLENKAKLQTTADKYNQLIEIHTVDADVFNEFPIADRFSKAIYLRFMIPQILSGDIDKVLYLDCDIVCIDSLNELWKTDLKDSYCGVCLDCNGDDIITRNRLNTYKVHVTWDDVFFNSGVLLFNMKQWRKNKLAHQLIEFIDKYKDVCSLYPDQDALNCLFAGNITLLPLRYNFQMSCMWKKQYIRLRRNLYSYIDDALKSPCLIHYTTSNKPWFPCCPNPMTPKFDYYRSISLWKETLSENLVKLPKVWRIKFYKLRHRSKNMFVDMAL